ncbi:cupin domain-containing protein [Rhodococcus opacus]|uniref:cupin domain-containing protein n=1 Tax=Rhodococcus opacus TaxID=37919 RepID=UPI00155B3D2D|nr:cupin domain-containing protein [Rhodococcus opacus]
MQIRRVVAGNDASGKTVFLSDDVVPYTHVYEHLRGQAHARIWHSHTTPTTTPPAEEPTSENGPILPEPGGTTFIIVQYAPDSVAFADDFDGAAAGGEFADKLPDLAASMDPAAPGIHTTRTVDLGLILNGEIWLELGGGEEKKLERGDTVVQIAGRHAWRNKSDHPATVAFVLAGASDPASTR